MTEKGSFKSQSKENSELSTDSKSGNDGRLLKREPDQIEYKKHISSINSINPPSLLQNYIYYRDFGINMFNALAYSFLELAISEQDRDSLFRFINSYQAARKEKEAEGLSFKKQELSMLERILCILKGIIDTIDNTTEDQIVLLFRIYYINHEAIAHLFKFFIISEAIQNEMRSKLRRDQLNLLDRHEKKANEYDLDLISTLLNLKIKKIINGSGKVKFKPKNSHSSRNYYSLQIFQSGTKIYRIYKISEYQDFEFPAEPMINSYPFSRNPKFVCKDSRKKKTVKFRQEDIDWKEKKLSQRVKCPNCNSDCLLFEGKFAFNCSKCIRRWCLNHKNNLKICKCLCPNCEHPMKSIEFLGKNVFYCKECELSNEIEEERKSTIIDQICSKCLLSSDTFICRKCVLSYLPAR